MKTQLKNFAFDYLWAFLLGLFLLYFVTACEPNATVEPTDNQAVPCGAVVTAVQMPCSAYGVFENIYFLTEKGEYLQPWDIFNSLQAIPRVVAGKKYTVGYEVVKRDNRYDNQIRCKLYDEKTENATPVKLTCLTEVANQTIDNQEVPCGLSVTAVQMSCAGYGAFGNVYFLTDSGKYLQPWEMFPTFAPVNITVGKRYIIGYKTVKRDERYKDLILCALYDEKAANASPIKLTCLTETTCGTTEATVKDNRPVDGCLELVLQDGKTLYPDLSDLNINLKNGQKVKFSYTLQKGKLPCGFGLGEGEVAKIKCLEIVGTNN